DSPTTLCCNIDVSLYVFYQLELREASLTTAIQKPGEAVTMNSHLICKQTYGHNNMFWYRQDPGQGLQLLFLFVNGEQIDKGNVTDRFQAKSPQTELLHLDISPMEPEDSAVYFCASSLDTVLQSHLLPQQKPPPLVTATLFPERGFPLHLYPQPVQ
uniref:Immunoglobulin V-set domain-containing protein n=1 Tax=Chelonoidis abingdonii TaxID=106734 RepID=A0A8C0H7T0_CHEAB